MNGSTFNSIQITAGRSTVLLVALGIAAMSLASTSAAPPVHETSAKSQSSHLNENDTLFDENEEHPHQSNDDTFHFRELREEAKRFQERIEKLNREHQRMLEEMHDEASGFDSLNPRLPSPPKTPKIPSPWNSLAPFGGDATPSPWQPLKPSGTGQGHKFSGPGSYSRSWRSSSSSEFNRSNDQFSARQTIRGIEVAVVGRVTDGKVTVASVSINDGNKQRFATVADVPSQYRDEVAVVLANAKKQLVTD